MKVREVEELLPISRANIRFYEKEGLLHPARLENGYRCYDENDIASLKKIILLRKLGISVPDIKRIMDGQLLLSEAVENNIPALKSQIGELLGAVSLSEQMLSDKSLDTNFALDTYWQAMCQSEKTGKSFMDYLHDYMKFESESFLAMWDNVFFFRMRELVTDKDNKKGWRFIVLIVLILCVLRGFFRRFLLHIDGFWESFFYPFTIFILVTVVTFPIYVLNEVYGERDMDESADKPQNKFMRFLRKHIVCKGLLTIISFLLIVFFPLALSNIFIEAMTGIHDNYIIAHKLHMLYFIAALFFAIILYWLSSDFGIFGNWFEDRSGYVCHLPHKIRRRVALVSFGIYMLVYVIFLGCYGCASETGITLSRFYITKEYSWSDVKMVTIKADNDGTLNYYICLNDDRTMDLLGSDVGTSSFNTDKYAYSDEYFVLELTKDFVQRGVFIDVNWEKLNKKLTYDYWKDYADELKCIIEDAAPSSKSNTPQ